MVSRQAVKPGLPYEIHFLLKLKITVKVSKVVKNSPVYILKVYDSFYSFTLKLRKHHILPIHVLMRERGTNAVHQRQA